MKASNFILLGLIVTLCICTFKIIKVQQKSSYDYIGDGFMGFVTSQDALDSHVKHDKLKKTQKIAFIGGGICVFLLIAFRVIKQKEDKNDPIKNLQNLRESSLIGEEEYILKVKKTKEVIEQGKVLNRKKEEQQRLISELNSLKKQGILTESEYNEKIDLVNKR